MCGVAEALFGAQIAMGFLGAAQDSRDRKETAQLNAQLAGIDASETLIQAEFAAQEAVRAGRGLKGRQVAAFAANGVDVNAGTAAAITDETDFFAAEDAYQLRRSGLKQAQRIRLQGSNYDRAARAENPFLAGLTGALGGATRVDPRWFR